MIIFLLAGKELKTYVVDSEAVVIGTHITCVASLNICCDSYIYLNTSPANKIVCHLLITFANNLDPDQARHFVGPDLDSNCLTL